MLKTGEVQTCFYNRNKSDVYFDSYLAKRVASLKNIKFFIEKTNFNCFDPLYKSFEFDQKISNLNLLESEEHFKSRNFLSNISYTGINKNDFYNESFILDVYILLVKNLNLFSLQRKLSDKLKQEMVYSLWRECILIEFYRHICKEKNLVYPNGRDVGQPGTLEIVGNFIDQGKENLRLLQEHLVRFKDIYQYVYSLVFPEIYTASEKRGFDLKSNFHIIFKSYRHKILVRQTAKQQSNY